MPHTILLLCSARGCCKVDSEGQASTKRSLGLLLSQDPESDGQPANHGDANSAPSRLFKKGRRDTGGARGVGRGSRDFCVVGQFVVLLLIRYQQFYVYILL